MTIYDLLYVMDNMSRDIVIHNDNDEDFGEKFRGEVSDFKMTDLYDEIEDEEVTDLFTEEDGTMYICYNLSEED